MKSLIKIEEFAMVAFSVYLLNHLEVPWWAYLVLLLGPDISMLGYVINNQIGAISYNIFHHKGVALVIYVSGLLWENESLQIAGILLFGHSSLDRMFGYGLKYSKGFKYTHLGEIGKKN